MPENNPNPTPATESNAMRQYLVIAAVVLVVLFVVNRVPALKSIVG